MSLSFQDIAQILKSIDESNAEEIEIEIEGVRLAVRKRTAGAPMQPAPAKPTQFPESTESPPAESIPATEESDRKSQGSEQAEAPPGHTLVRAPMVGTFYRRADPESEPFVEPGSTIKAGEPLCLIEVMKLYTTIESTVTGTVVSIFAQDAQLVEFDQQLFLIKHDSNP